MSSEHPLILVGGKLYNKWEDVPLDPKAYNINGKRHEYKGYVINWSDRQWYEVEWLSDKPRPKELDTAFTDLHAFRKAVDALVARLEAEKQ